MTELPVPFQPAPLATFPPPKKRRLLFRVGARIRSALTVDLPLKALALVLAALAWLVVREKLETDETISNVPVEIVVPDSIVVLTRGDPAVTLRLRGTWGEVARARQAIASARGIRLRLQQPDVSNVSGTAALRATSAFDFPFDFPQIVTVETPLLLDWSVVEQRNLPVDAPSITWTGVPEVASAEPTLDRATVRVRGPATLVRSLRSLPLDPVDATRWLKTKPDLATPYPWESRFEQWRRENLSLRGPKVVTIEPETITGKVRFRPVTGRVVAGILRWEIANPRWQDSHIYEIRNSPEYDPATNVLRVAVRGNPDVLDRMEKDPSSWNFGVPLPPPPDGDTEQQDIPVPVYLRGPNGSGVVLEKAPTVFVSVRRRASGG